MASGSPRVSPEILARLLGEPPGSEDLAEDVLAGLARYAGLLLAWGARINLTAARDLETLAHEHLTDALSLRPHLPQAGRLIDVGSGAGLPGIPIAILRPDLEVTLLEPRGRRHAFLRAVCRELPLANVTALRERVEEHAGGPYDVAVSRATFPLAEWLERAPGLVGAGGRILGLEGATHLEPLPPATSRHETGRPDRAVLVRRI